MIYQLIWKIICGFLPHNHRISFIYIYVTSYCPRYSSCHTYRMYTGHRFHPHAEHKLQTWVKYEQKTISRFNEMFLEMTNKIARISRESEVKLVCEPVAP